MALRVLEKKCDTSVLSWTAVEAAWRYAGIMTFAQRKLLVLAVWVATVGIVGTIVAIDKPNLWMLVACFALIPAAIGNWFWNAPQATLSQLIARARSRS